MHCHDFSNLGPLMGYMSCDLLTEWDCCSLNALFKSLTVLENRKVWFLSLRKSMSTQLNSILWWCHIVHICQNPKWQKRHYLHKWNVGLKQKQMSVPFCPKNTTFCLWWNHPPPANTVVHYADKTHIHVFSDCKPWPLQDFVDPDNKFFVFQEDIIDPTSGLVISSTTTTSTQCWSLYSTVWTSGLVAVKVSGKR